MKSRSKPSKKTSFKRQTTQTKVDAAPVKYSKKTMRSLHALSKVTAPTYVAGQCNLTDRGVEMRMQVGMVAGILGILAMICARYLFNGQTSVIALIAAFLGLGSASISHLQAKRRFCVSNAMNGIYETEKGNAPIANPYDKLKDVAYARGMAVEALFMAIAIWLGLYGILFWALR